MGDIVGGIALLKLARLYERTNEADQAAAAYTQYIQAGAYPGGMHRMHVHPPSPPVHPPPRPCASPPPHLKGWL